jgi:hypothetical protein
MGVLIGISAIRGISNGGDSGRRGRDERPVRRCEVAIMLPKMVIIPVPIVQFAILDEPTTHEIRESRCGKGVS